VSPSAAPCSRREIRRLGHLLTFVFRLGRKHQALLFPREALFSQRHSISCESVTCGRITAWLPKNIRGGCALTIGLFRRNLNRAPVVGGGRVGLLVRKTTVNNVLLTLILPLFQLKPSFLNLFMKKFTRERVVRPCSPESLWETFRQRADRPDLVSIARESRSVRARRFSLESKS